jgi:hypothetical protein
MIGIAKLFMISPVLGIVGVIGLAAVAFGAAYAAESRPYRTRTQTARAAAGLLWAVASKAVEPRN